MTSTAPARRAEPARLPWWTTGDWNGLFGLGTNVLLNVIVIAGLCLGVVGLTGDTVYGRILPPWPSRCRWATRRRAVPG